MKHEPAMAYDTKKLNKLFAVLALLLLLVLTWVFLDDYIRPWKAFQIKGMSIKKEVVAQQIEQEKKAIKPEDLAALNQQLQVHKKAVEKQQSRLETIADELREVAKKIYVQNMVNGDNGSKAGEYQFNYEHAVAQGHDKEARQYQVKLTKFKDAFNQGRDDLKAFLLRESELKAEEKKLTLAYKETEKKISSLTAPVDRLEVVMKQQEPGLIWMLRNSPFIDYLDPTIKINQIVLNNLADDRYFQKTAKVDRCTTCHVFIADPGFEKYDNPYKTHPKLETLAVGRESAHPIKSFGCTSCHGGEGHRVNDFSAPVHTPQNDEQKVAWIDKYHWHAPHKSPSPMLPLQYTEGACVKCHQGVDRIVMGDKVNEGRELIENYGCYGCHKIDGWQHLKKPGPSLEKVASKLTAEFMKNWIWSPHAFNAHSRMPAFFNQVNNKKPEFARLNIAEVNSMVEYLKNNSKEYQPFASYKVGNASNGKELIQSIGCIGCHQVEGIDEPYSNVKSKKANYLTGLGSKVTPDWLVSWLLKPSHYQPDTIMPSFRLTETEANDIATFLLEQKNKTFEKLVFESLDLKAVEELLVESYSTFDPISVAKKVVSQMSPQQMVEDLGKKSLSKYGCYSCHNINGFSDDLPPIGPELTKVGSKPIEQFGWGQQKQLEHTRHNWIWHHLEQPARWDIGVVKGFKDLNKMPNFYLDSKDITSMTTYLLGLVDEYVPPMGRKNLSAREAIAEAGKKVANKYNCQGCHVIDGMGGKLTRAFADDPNLGAPWLVKEGERVYADWLLKFLKAPFTIRPYVNVRMPTFNYSQSEMNALINYFVIDANQDHIIEQEVIQWAPGEREAAQEIFKELACTSCHTTGFSNETAQGPNLHHSKLRLRKNWIKKWLTNPQEILPYTPMPNFWDGGKTAAVEGRLDNDPQKQIEAVTKYVLEMGLNTYPASTQEAVPFRKE